MDSTFDFAALFKEFDTLVMGRKTFEVLRKQGPGGPTSGMKIIVASTTLQPSDIPGVTVIGHTIADEIARLKQLKGKDLWLFGGGTLFRSLLDARLVDTIELAIMPILLSQGIPVLLPGLPSPPLRLDSCRTLPSGIVLIRYRIGE